MLQPARIFVTAEIAQACPGHREARIYLREPGTPEPYGVIAFPQSQADDREALAAFGWRVVGELDYVAGLNQSRGTAERCEPETGEALRETVRREIRARSLARLAHSTARHFHPVQLNGDHSRNPIGWTFLAGRGEAAAYGWVTATGEVSLTGIANRADATREVRHAHMLGAEAGPVARVNEAQLQAKTGDELARLLLTVRSGGQIVQEEAADGDHSARVYPAGVLAPMRERELAANRCVHHQYAAEAVTGDPVKACARKSSGDRFGVFTDEGCAETFDCAVQAANAALVLDADAGESLHRWEALCSEHEEQPAGTCEECAADGAEAEDAEEDVPPFEEGDRIVCADGVTRTVKGMAPRITGEPVRVVVEDGAEWIAENCLRANWEDVLDAHRKCNAAGQRVRTNPDSSDPEWRAALAELGAALDYLRQADPTVRVALAEDEARQAAKRVHPKACNFQPVHRPGEDEPAGWSFSIGHGARIRYGVVSRLGEIAPIGVHEYRTTAERAFLRGPREEAPAAG
ncbi:hypothetical protein [Streptomyces collinus]